MGITDYRNETDAANTTIINDLITIQTKDEQWDVLLQEVNGYIQEEHENLYRRVQLKGSGKKELSFVVEEWLDQKKGVNHLNKDEVLRKLMDAIVGWGKLEPLISDPEITDVFTNEQLEVIKRLKNGKDVKTNIVFEGHEELEKFIKSIVQRITGSAINRDVCIRDLMDDFSGINGVRVTAGISGQQDRGEVIKAPFLVLRLFPINEHSREFFVGNDTFDDEIADFMEQNLLETNNVYSGPPSAGKTTIMKYMRGLVKDKDPMRRTIVIQDQNEINDTLENSISFISRMTDEESERKAYDRREFAKIAQRLSASDVVDGEMRGEEMWEILRLVNMGMRFETSVHSNSGEETLDQLTFYASMGSPQIGYNDLLRRITESFNFIIHIENKKIVSISEIVKFDVESKKPILNHVFELDINEDGKLYWKKNGLTEKFLKSKAIKRKLKEREV